MTATILVTGGTGTLGRHVLPLLRETGSPLRVLSRRERPSADGVEYVTGDLLTGTGTDAAVDGVDTVLHLAGGNKGDEVVARHLVDAAQRAGTKHLVHISVIGADALPLKWLRSQVAAENVVTGSGIPYTILRAAQFHDLTLAMVRKLAKLPVVPDPGGLRLQPVDSRDVAERLAELTLADPAGRVRDLADGVPAARAGRELPDQGRQAADVPAGADPGCGRPGLPCRRQPERPGRHPRQPQLGGVPGRAGQLSSDDATSRTRPETSCTSPVPSTGITSPRTSYNSINGMVCSA